MRIWNSRETAHDEALRGLMLANPGKFELLSTEYGYGLSNRNLPEKKVRIIINGGGGYGPMWAGFAGKGLADAMVHGKFDSAPNAFMLYEMAKKIEDGCGVLFLTNHFMGDYLNNDMAVELLARDGIEARVCYVSDDILSCVGEEKENRGGLHGIGQICKIAAEAAGRGRTLDEVYRLAEKANDRMRSISVNIRGQKVFFGEGFSGEPAVKISDYVSVSEMVREACEVLLGEMKEWENEPVYISLNPNCGVGYTESLVILNAVAEEMKRLGRNIFGCACGTYFDVFQGQGFMINVLACDDELKSYLHQVTGFGFTV